MHYSFNEEQKVLLTFNSMNHAIIARKMQEKSFFRKFKQFKIYNRWHKFKILIAKNTPDCIEYLIRIKINVYFEKASKAVESGRYVLKRF